MAGNENTVGDIAKQNLNPEGVDRRALLKCMAWATRSTLPSSPEFILRTGDLSPVPKEDEFDAVDQI